MDSFLLAKMASALAGNPFLFNPQDRISAYLRAGIKLGKLTTDEFLDLDRAAFETERDRRSKMDPSPAG